MEALHQLDKSDSLLGHHHYGAQTLNFQKSATHSYQTCCSRKYISELHGEVISSILTEREIKVNKL
ncbi:CLUMA_CG006064, isoform A [Clunio marinus]|uniref:CLUMA_CG006064, isoform A n=1 Tax=Clunio marinus TaxID=568069 RepID=A0A1J1HWM7_9DIPT|nr:CLUMA_CG006064, isoform A [Clunio marinus]